MPKIFREMTDNMNYLYCDVLASLGQMPIEKRAYIFGIDEEEDMDWVIGVLNYIIVEYIKYSFDYDDPEYPLNHFVDYNNDSERMLQSRTMQYVAKYKKKQLETHAIALPEDHKFANLDLDTIEKRLKGRRLTEMNYYEHQNIHNVDLIKAIVERRIVSSKKVSNERFQEMFEQYDQVVQDLIERSKKSDEDMVFASLALFTLEWNYPVELFYYLACVMEGEGITDIRQDDLALICGDVWIESQFGGSASTHSRMVKERFCVVETLFGKDTDEFVREELRDLIKEILVLGVEYKELIGSTDGGLYKEWFRRGSSIEDWASFFRWYDIFSIWEKKEWTRTRIQNMRKLFDLVLAPKS